MWQILKFVNIFMATHLKCDKNEFIFIPMSVFKQMLKIRVIIKIKEEKEN